MREITDDLCGFPRDKAWGNAAYLGDPYHKDGLVHCRAGTQNGRGDRDWWIAPTFRRDDIHLGPL